MNSIQSDKTLRIKLCMTADIEENAKTLSTLNFFRTWNTIYMLLIYMLPLLHFKQPIHAHNAVSS